MSKPENKTAVDFLKEQPEWNYGQWRAKEVLIAMESYSTDQSIIKQNRIDELEYKLTIEQVKFASLIQTIENRIAMLKGEHIEQGNPFKPDYYNAKISELRNLLTLIKS